MERHLHTRHLPTRPQGTTTRKTNSDIFTAVRTSNLTEDKMLQAYEAALAMLHNYKYFDYIVYVI